MRATNSLSRDSLRNQWLIALESHARGFTPTYVAGFRTFLQLNRCVRNGERAIRILAPVAVKERDEHGEETGDKRVFFLTVPVSDVSRLTLNGIYPRNDRNALLLRGGSHACGELPITDWGGEFADNHMPDAIKAAITASRTDVAGTIDSAEWRERLAERFGSRWRIPKVRVSLSGLLSVDPNQSGTRPHVTKVVKRKSSRGSQPGTGGRGGSNSLGGRQGAASGSVTQVAGGIPRYRTVSPSDVGLGMLAAWAPHDPTYKEGAVLINVEHEELRGQIAHWQSQYPDHWAEDIQKEVIDAYGQIAVSKVAHSEFLKGILPAKIVDDELRSEAALTMSLLGLMAEESILATRIGGKFKRNK